MTGKRALSAIGERWSAIPGRSRAALMVFALCLVVYTASLVFVPRFRGVTTTQGDETHYLVITQSILEDGDLFLNNQYEEKSYQEFYEIDEILLHAAEGRGGNYVSTHPPFLSMLVLPAFWLFGYKGAAMTMVLITCLSAVLVFLVTDRFVTRPVAVVTTLFVFFSYPVLFYSRLIYPETVAIFLVALALWSGWCLRENGKLVHAAVLGLCSGGILLFHPKYIAISVSLFLLFLMVGKLDDRRMWIAWFAPAALSVLLLIALTAWAFGPEILKGLTASGGSKFQGGFWGTNSVWGIPGMYLDRAWGLFIFAPFMMLFPFGLGLLSNRFEWKRWWAFFPLCIVIHTALLGLFQSWNGGAAPVQRYLVPLIALFVPCIALFIDRVRSALGWTVAGVLALLQVVTTVWTFRFFQGVYGMEAADNIFLMHFLGENGFVKRLLLAVFPLYHPSSGRAVFLTVAWLLIFVAGTYLSRRFYMRHGGGRVSPLADIRPFVRQQ